jgi:hypothetical protein
VNGSFLCRTAGITANMFRVTKVNIRVKAGMRAVIIVAGVKVMAMVTVAGGTDAFD